MTEAEQGLLKETLGVPDNSSAPLDTPPGSMRDPTRPDFMETTQHTVTVKLAEETQSVTLPFSPANNLSENSVNTTENSQVVGNEAKQGVLEGVSDIALVSDEKENVSNENPVVELRDDVMDEIKEEIEDDLYATSYEAEFQPKVIKLVNIRGEPFICQICGYQSRHLRWLRYHESVCQRQGPPTVPKGTLIFARPAGMAQQLMINSDLVKMVYPGQTVRLISPQLNSTADLIANNTASPHMRQVVTPANMTRFVSPTAGNPTIGARASTSTQNPLQCQLCTFIAATTDALAVHVKINHAPVYSCNYCTFKTKLQDDIRTHLEYQCTLRPPKCYTCLLCNDVIQAVEDIEKHFREKHPKYQLNAGNIPVRMGFGPPSHNSTDLARRLPLNSNPPPSQLQPMMMTPSRQKDILDGFHLCRYCPFKSKKAAKVNDHMKFGHLGTFEFDRNFSEGSDVVVSYKKQQKPGCPGKIDLRTSCVESGNFESLEFLPPDSSPTFTSTTVIGRPKCAGKRRQDMSYVIQDKIDSIKCGPKEKNFHCEYCDFKTTTTFNLKRHIKNRHKDENPQQEVKVDNTVICQYCNEQMNMGSLKRHIKSKHPEMIEVSSTPTATVPCPYCDFTTNSSHNLRRHASKKHRDKFKGPAATPSNSILNNVHCQYCKFRTSSEYNLEIHVNKVHRQPLQASPIKETPGTANMTMETDNIVNVEQAPPPQKEVKPPKEKTLSCKKCVFKTAYSQNLRRHYEKNHKDVYPILYPERYAREEAKKANAHNECKTLTISAHSQITPSATVATSSSENSVPVIPAPNVACVPQNSVTVVPAPNVACVPQKSVTLLRSPNVTCVPQNSVTAVPTSNVVRVPEDTVPLVAPANLPPNTPSLAQSIGQPTSNTPVDSVEITDNPNCSTLLYKPNITNAHHPHNPPNAHNALNTPRIINIGQGFAPSPVHVQMNNHNNNTNNIDNHVAHSSSSLPPQNCLQSATSATGPHQNNIANSTLCQPKVVPLLPKSQCDVSFSDQNVVNSVCDKL